MPKMERPQFQSNKTSRLSAAFTDFERARKAKKWLFDYIKSFRSVELSEKTPHRSAFIRAHYDWTALIFGLLFTMSVSSWYGETPITCIEQYDRTLASEEVMEICMQFPYTRKNKESLLDGKKYYALYYMWVHWLCIFLYFIFKSVLGVVLILENNKLRKFLITLNNVQHYDKRLHFVINYFQENFGSHMGMVRNKIVITMFAIFINVSVFFGIDILLERNYWNIPLMLTVTRDCTFFDDAFSIIFPSFAYCDFDPLLHIQVGRYQLFGCHLPLNEIYGKFFVALWFWQVFLLVWGLCSLLHWGFIFINQSCNINILDNGCYRRYPSVRKAASSFSTDEAIAINLIKPYLFGSYYRALICDLSEWDPQKNFFSLKHIKDRPLLPDILQRHTNYVEEHSHQGTYDSIELSKLNEPSTIFISDKENVPRISNEDANFRMNDTSFFKSNSPESPYSEELIKDMRNILNKKNNKLPATGWAVPLAEMAHVLDKDEDDFLDDISDLTNCNNLKANYSHINYSTENFPLTSTEKKIFPPSQSRNPNKNSTKNNVRFSETIINPGPNIGFKSKCKRSLFPFNNFSKIPKTDKHFTEQFTNSDNASSNTWEMRTFTDQTRELVPRSHSIILPTAPLLGATSSSESNDEITNGKLDKKNWMVPFF